MRQSFDSYINYKCITFEYRHSVIISKKFYGLRVHNVKSVFLTVKTSSCTFLRVRNNNNLVTAISVVHQIYPCPFLMELILNQLKLFLLIKRQVCRVAVILSADINIRLIICIPKCLWEDLRLRISVLFV